MQDNSILFFSDSNFVNNVFLLKTATVSWATAAMPTEVPVPPTTVQMPTVIALLSESKSVADQEWTMVPNATDMDVEEADAKADSKAKHQEVEAESKLPKEARKH